MITFLREHNDRWTGQWAPQSRQSAKPFLQSSDWDSPNPSPAGECAVHPSLWFRGEGHTRWQERGRESPYSNDGTYTVVLFIVLCGGHGGHCRYSNHSKGSSMHHDGAAMRWVQSSCRSAVHGMGHATSQEQLYRSSRLRTVTQTQAGTATVTAAIIEAAVQYIKCKEQLIIQYIIGRDNGCRPAV